MPLAGVRTGLGTLTPMAFRRLRARVSWASRWGGLLLCLPLSLLLAMSALRQAGVVVSVPSRSLRATVMTLPGLARIEILRYEAPGVDPPSIEVFCDKKQLETPRPSWRWWHWRYRKLVPWLSNGIGPVPANAVRPKPRFWIVEFPLWTPLAFAAALTAVPWCLRVRRRRHGLVCPSCHYDLYGLPAGAPCPECATEHRPPED